MFVRTKRLTLRPGWIEDAPELTRAIGHWEVVRHLGRAPWPYRLADAQAFLAGQKVSARAATFLICAREGDTAPIIGAVDYGPRDIRDGETGLGYWLTPSAWGKGYATEAARAAIEVARTMGVKRIVAGHFIDNPASGRVLRKLGFQPVRTTMQHSAARGHSAESAEFVLHLAKEAEDDPDFSRMAA